jgi:hypothetical protein
MRKTVAERLMNANGDANSPSPAGCRANRALVETLDKDAIRAWLR